MAPPAMSARDAIVAPLLLMTATPVLCHLTAFMTNSSVPTLSGFAALVRQEGAMAVTQKILASATPTFAAAKLLLAFNGLALLLYFVPGKTKYGPLTPNGARPDYVDNGVAHCALFTLVFLGASDWGLGLYPLSILYDHFEATLGCLDLFGLLFCVALYFKGLSAPSGPDSGSSGCGPIFDYYWGTELYPRILGVDVKKFVNCRFSMTYWMLAGVSFAAASYRHHGFVDPGIVLCAASQFLYLCKFYVWEIGYMRSIDIITDRAGFMETWGCITWVPAIYTLHTRSAVALPSGLSWPAASFIFIIGLAGVFLNYQADTQRQRFRETGGKCAIWGKTPVFVKATYQARDDNTGQLRTHESLLLASGWWGVGRHAQYMFELIAAWSWGLLAGVGAHGPFPLFYPIFLTILLVHRAVRDEQKCLAKYGEDYKKYMAMVPYKIVPLVY